MKPDTQTLVVPELPKNVPPPPVATSPVGQKPGAKPQSAPSWVTSGKGTAPGPASGSSGGKQLTGQ